MTELVRVIVENGIGELVLNRPQQRNSLIGPLVWEMQSGLEKLEKDEGCNSIVIRGEQGYFCAGLDLKTRPLTGEAGFRMTGRNSIKRFLYPINP